VARTTEENENPEKEKKKGGTSPEQGLAGRRQAKELSPVINDTANETKKKEREENAQPPLDDRS